MTRPPAHGYVTLESDVLHGMSKRHKTIAAVIASVTAGVLLSGCGTATIAGTATPAAGAADLTTSTSTAPTTNRTTTAPRPLTFDDRVRAMVDDALAFWRPLTGDPLNDVTVTIYDAARPDSCRLDGGFAAVCSSPDGSNPEITVERDTVRPLTDTGNKTVDDMTLAIFMSHEVGHIVANRAAGHRVEGIVGEQRAECAAGVFVTQQGATYGGDADLTRAYERRVKVFEVLSDDPRAVQKATAKMKAAFIEGSESLTPQDCALAYPE
ncbi:hypothetical protein [Mycobacteroides abscessus]|uniref:hypothetical protein n=1 Tax=Mycobacteroides abscessus TaxID=36809 RepID=UPI002648B726|nr:hypothetical protein [Mycobacteroides abscessus]MDO3357797.1 hypothetical protein [Mycobacteroides abscessus subsp. massiliense]WKE45632.1 hypothetical protein P3M63_07460 [Mycobacteroides abscessus subsp. massiliense]